MPRSILIQFPWSTWYVQCLGRSEISGLAGGQTIQLLAEGLTIAGHPVILYRNYSSAGQILNGIFSLANSVLGCVQLVVQGGDGGPQFLDTTEPVGEFDR